MNTRVRYALSQGFTLRWETDHDSGVCRLKLKSITWTFENGRERTRTVFDTCDIAAAVKLHGEILAQGATVRSLAPVQIFERWQERE